MFLMRAHSHARMHGRTNARMLALTYAFAGIYIRLERRAKLISVCGSDVYYRSPSRVAGNGVCETQWRVTKSRQSANAEVSEAKRPIHIFCVEVNSLHNRPDRSPAN